jgi:hypothetical protein
MCEFDPTLRKSSSTTVCLSKGGTGTESSTPYAGNFAKGTARVGDWSGLYLPAVSIVSFSIDCFVQEAPQLEDFLVKAYGE